MIVVLPPHVRRFPEEGVCYCSLANQRNVPLSNQETTTPNCTLTSTLQMSG